MKNLTNTMRRIWEDESAQGATEYILLLMIVVAIVLLFKDNIRGLVQGRLDSLGSGLGEVSTNF